MTHAACWLCRWRSEQQPSPQLLLLLLLLHCLLHCLPQR
jgi:hypothetical protein